MMKKSLAIFCLILCLNSVVTKPLFADLTPQKIRELYATLPFEARGIYNQKARINFAEFSAINGFFSSVFSQKVEKISSAKINFQPKMAGWTALVFKTIYESADPAKDLPLGISARLNDIFGGVRVSAALGALPEINFDSHSFKIAPLILAFLFLTSILPIHEIKFRIFIQRE